MMVDVCGLLFQSILLNEEVGEVADSFQWKASIVYSAEHEKPIFF